MELEIDFSMIDMSELEDLILAKQQEEAEATPAAVSELVPEVKKQRKRKPKPPVQKEEAPNEPITSAMLLQAEPERALPYCKPFGEYHVREDYSSDLPIVRKMAMMKKTMALTYA